MTQLELLQSPATIIRANFDLRDYQLQVVSDLYRFFRKGFRSGLVYGPTGCGKTAIATRIIADAVARGRRVLFCCHRKKLVGQTQESLRKFYGIEAGVIWADNPIDYSLPVQIGMIQTIQNRQLPPDIGLVIFDECHSSIYYKICWDIMHHYSGGIFALSQCFFVGLSATPWRTKVKEGFCQFFQFVVMTPYPIDLVKQGWLARPRHFGYRGLVDFSLLEVGSSGDYTEASMAKLLDDEFNAKVVEHFMELCSTRKAIAFCGSVAQARDLARQFNEVGVSSELVVGETPDDEREQIYQRFRERKTQLISSCLALCEGFDEPSVQAAIIARPTRSRALLVQMAGRALRLHAEKTDAYLLDFCENFDRKRHGLVTKKYPIALCPKDRLEPPALTKECPSCHEMVNQFVKICPHCGLEFLTDGDAEEDIEDGKLPDFGEILSEEEERQLRYVRSQMLTAYKKGRNPSRIKSLFYKKFGYFAPDIWFVGAIFRGKYPESSRQEYLQFLQKIRPDAPDVWVKYMLNLEFGQPGKEYRLKGGSTYTPPPIEIESPQWWQALNVDPLAPWSTIKKAYQDSVKAWSDSEEELAADQIRLLNLALQQAKGALGVE
jgi:superfamily II DNA or RNA helicase